MIFSKHSGTLVCTSSFLPAEVSARLATFVPGDDPFMSLRALFFVRGDSATVGEQVTEMAEWMDLYGRVRQAGLSIEDVEGVLAKNSGISTSTGLEKPAVPAPPREMSVTRSQPLFGEWASKKKRKSVSKKTSKKIEKKVVPFVAPVASANGSAPLERGTVLEVGQEFLHVTRGVTARLDAFSSDKLSGSLRWEDGKTQLVTLKTLRDKRRYRAI